MAWKIWKNETERFEEEMRKAFDNRNKNKIEKAIEHFANAYKIANSSSDPSLREKARIAYAYMLIYNAIQYKSTDILKNTFEYLASLPGDIELDLALPRPVKVGELVEDFKILSLLSSIPSIELENASSINLEEARRIREVGEYLLSKGSKRLILEDIFNIKEPMNIIALRLLGYSKLIEATHIEKEDLNKSIELYAEALVYFQQAADKIASNVMTKIEKLGKATKCWICGRAIQGEDVNFIYLDSFLTKYIVEKYSGDAPGILISEHGKIATCSACYGVIYNLSDKIARHYYQEAMKALRELEQRLLAIISQLQAQINMLQTRITSIESSISSLRTTIMFKR
ncbi:MAG: hypothetical protein QXJ84_01740 [Desulfurococcaceae archaeon]